MQVLRGVFLIGGIMLAGCEGNTPATQVATTASTAEAPKGYAATDFDSIALKQSVIRPCGISIAHPERWVEESSPGIWAYKMQCPATQDSTRFCANYVINTIPRNKKISLETYADTLLARFEGKPEVTSFKVIGNNPQVINGLPALVIDYKALVYNRQIGGTTALFEVADNVVVITFLASNNPPKSYVRYRGLYARILATIQPLNR